MRSLEYVVACIFLAVTKNLMKYICSTSLYYLWIASDGYHASKPNKLVGSRGDLDLFARSN